MLSFMEEKTIEDLESALKQLRQERTHNLSLLRKSEEKDEEQKIIINRNKEIDDYSRKINLLLHVWNKIN